MKAVTILGTRPEIIKMSPLLPKLDKGFNHVLIHTNQHYSENMDRIFFRELKLQEPRYNLNIGSGTHAEQTSKMMAGLEKALLRENPSFVVVNGDTNTTMAGALTAAKLRIPLVHVEAGCRSFNRNMPEEINRIIADHCSNFLVATDKTSHDNLISEGIPKKSVVVSGSTAIEAALRNRKFAGKSQISNELGLKKKKYILCTIHRAENTNNVNILKGIVEALNSLSRKIRIVFPMHPRTGKIIKENKIKLSTNMKTIEPQGYLEFLNLMDNSLLVMSDSGGIQEESAALDVPCLILRNETEWTYLTEAGKNMLLGTSAKGIISKTEYLLNSRKELEKMSRIRIGVEGNASKVIMKAIKKFVNEIK